MSTRPEVSGVNKEEYHEPGNKLPEMYDPGRQSKESRRFGVLTPHILAAVSGALIFLVESPILQRDPQEVFLTTFVAAVAGFVAGIKDEPPDDNTHQRSGVS